MPIKHNYTILCDYIMKDESGKYGFIGTFINVTLDTVPGRLIRFCVAVGFSGESNNPLHLIIRNPNRKPLVAVELTREKEPPETEPFQQSMYVVPITLQAFPFEKLGVHDVVLLEGKKIVHRLPFGVLLKKDQDKEAA